MDEDEHNKELEKVKREMSINRRETVYQKERRRSDGMKRRVIIFFIMSAWYLVFVRITLQMCWESILDRKFNFFDKKCKSFQKERAHSQTKIHEKLKILVYFEIYSSRNFIHAEYKFLLTCFWKLALVA